MDKNNYFPNSSLKNQDSAQIAQTIIRDNSSGHNPLVVNRHADLVKAVEAAIRLQLYYQGETAPSAILVESSIYKHTYMWKEQE